MVSIAAAGISFMAVLVLSVLLPLSLVIFIINVRPYAPREDAETPHTNLPKPCQHIHIALKQMECK